MFWDAQTRMQPTSLEVPRSVYHLTGRHSKKSAPVDLPNKTGNHDGGFSSEGIGYEAGRKSAYPGTPRHGGGDASLGARSRAGALIVGSPRPTLIEVTLVLPCAKNGTLRRDIKTEQSATNDGDGGNNVDVSNRHCGEKGKLSC